MKPEKESKVFTELRRIRDERLAEGVTQINPIRIYWWLIIFPGGVMVATLMALNFIGDGLRDAWDIKAR